jgi:hypothetical protein
MSDGRGGTCLCDHGGNSRCPIHQPVPAERCPTCGSDDKLVKACMSCGLGNPGHDYLDCTDPWHVTAPMRAGGAQSEPQITISYGAPPGCNPVLGETKTVWTEAASPAVAPPYGSEGCKCSQYLAGNWDSTRCEIHGATVAIPSRRAYSGQGGAKWTGHSARRKICLNRGSPSGNE